MTDKTIVDLKLQLDDLSKKIEVNTQENQTLQTKLAVADERFEKQVNETDKIEQQYELRLKHLLDEKHQAIEKVDQLQTEVSQLRQHLSDQAEKHHAVLAKERELQEDSEKRWVQLIDQARSEANSWRKKYDETTRKQNDRIASLQDNLIKLQGNLTTTRTTLNHKNDMIDELKKHQESMQNQYTTQAGELAVLKSRLKAVTSKQSSKKLAEAV